MNDVSTLKIAEQNSPGRGVAEVVSVAISDEALVQRLRSGDTLAGRALVERYSVALLRYLQRLTRSESGAEDLHQQTWTSVLEHIDRFDRNASPGGFKAWIYRIATNKANDLFRSRGRQKTAHEGLRLVTDEESPDASTHLNAAEQEAKLKWAIDQLPENQKQIVVLRYYSNLKFVEIAEMLGCPLNTALGRMHKAIIKLRSLMDGQVKNDENTSSTT